MATYIRLTGSKDNTLVVQGDPRATMGTLTLDTTYGFALLQEEASGKDVWVNPANVAYVSAWGNQ